jgi:Na+-driven multidrug efflux pump
MLLTGQLGATVSAAQTVVFNTISLLFMIPLAISVAVTTRAGQALGAGDEALAKLTSKLSLIMIACVQSCIGLTLIALRHKWGYIFSSSDAVVEEVAKVLPVCGCYAVLDAICGVSAGILRACGKQVQNAFFPRCNFVTFCRWWAQSRTSSRTGPSASPYPPCSAFNRGALQRLCPCCVSLPCR